MACFYRSMLLTGFHCTQLIHPAGQEGSCLVRALQTHESGLAAAHRVWRHACERAYLGTLGVYTEFVDLGLCGFWDKQWYDPPIRYREILTGQPVPEQLGTTGARQGA